MKVLVTGGAGFIGNNLIRSLLGKPEPIPAKDPINILNLDALTYAANTDALAELALDRRYRMLKIDLQDAAAVRDALHDFQPDWVMHLAAESHVDRSIKDPGTFIQSNIVGTYNLLQASLEYWQALPAGVLDSKSSPSKESFRLLNLSTDEVYGSLTDGGAFDESSPFAPNSPYAASKAASDHLARAWFVTYGLPVITARASNNFGPYQHPEKLIPTVILKALAGREIPIYGNGLNTRDWLFVEDCVDALCLLISRGMPGESYNVGAANERTNLAMAKQICAMLDQLRPQSAGGRYAEQINFVADRLGHDFRYAIDATKIQRELGWMPRNDFDAALRKTVGWYIEHAQSLKTRTRE